MAMEVPISTQRVQTSVVESAIDGAILFSRASCSNSTIAEAGFLSFQGFNPFDS